MKEETTALIFILLSFLITLLIFLALTQKVNIEPISFMLGAVVFFIAELITIGILGEKLKWKK